MIPRIACPATASAVFLSLMVGLAPMSDAALAWPPGSAQCTVSWISTTGGDWSTGSNWSSGVVPAADDDVCIAVSGTYAVRLRAATAIRSLTLGTGDTEGRQTLQVESNLQISEASQIEATGSLVIHAATFENSAPLVVDGRLLLLFTTSTLTGAGDVVVNGEVIFSAAAVISGGGAFTIAEEGSLTGRIVLDGRTLTNYGLLEWARIELRNGAVVDNRGTLVKPPGSAFIGDVLGEGTFINGGTVTLMRSAAIRVPFSNTGTIEVEENLELTQPSDHSGATIAVADGRTLRLRGAYVHRFENTTVGVTGTIVVESSTLEVAAPFTVGGRLVLLTSSTLTGNGDVTVEGTLAVQERTWILGSGALDISEAGKLTVNTTTHNLTLSRMLTNHGTIEWTYWTGSHIVLADGAVFDNRGSIVTDNEGIKSISGDGRFVNAGTVAVTAPMRIGVPFENDGVVDIGAARYLRLEAPFENSVEGTLQGNGTLMVDNPDFRNRGTIAPGASAGTFTISSLSAPYRSDGGTLAIELGGTSPGDEHDVLILVIDSEVARIDGTLDVRLVDGFVPAPGDVFEIIKPGWALDRPFAGGFNNIDGAMYPAENVALYPQLEGNTLRLVASSEIGTVQPGMSISGPDWLQGGGIAELSLLGNGFAPDVSVRLVCRECSDAARFAEVPVLLRSISPTRVDAAVDVSDGDLYGTFDVVAEDPRGGWASVGPITVYPPPVTVTVEVTQASASEVGPTPGVITLRSNQSVVYPVPVHFTLGGSATHFVDYVTNAPRNTMLMPAGSRETTVRIFPIADDVEEGNETVVLSLAAGRGYVLGDTKGGTVTIADGPSTEIFDAYAVSPTRGGNDGTVTLTVVGQAFQEGARLVLRRGGDEIEGLETAVDDRSSAMVAVFDLTGRAVGAWDVVVVNGDGASATLPQSFTLETVRRPDLWVDVVGPETRRMGGLVRYTVSVHNRGNVDAVGVPLYIKLARGAGMEDAEVDLLFGVADMPPLDLDDFTGWDEIPLVFEADEYKLVPLFLPIVPAGGVISLPLRARTTQIDAWVTEPMFDRLPIGEAAERARFNSASLAGFAALTEDEGSWGPCIGAVVSLIATIIPGGDCVKSAGLMIGKMIVGRAGTIGGLMASEGTNTDMALATQQIMASMLSVVFSCAKELVPFAKIIHWAVVIPLEVASIINSCTNWMAERPGASTRTRVLASMDPNDKLGPTGAGDERFIGSLAPFTYQIRFENVATATAPAAEVVVVDTLDVSVFDLSTFSLGTMYFGERSVTPPRGLSSWNTTVDLRPDVDVVVHIHAALDAVTGIATWRFTALDPETGEWPEDPLIGFLPPNQNPPEGDGGVFFTIQPRQTLLSGAGIENAARIFFDFNEPIDTPVWANRVDMSPPTSVVAALDSVQYSTTFTVSWSGSDVGAGIASYTVFVSTEGGPFEMWLAPTAENSAEFTGEPEVSYAFYSVARDGAGNLQVTPSEAHTATRVSEGATPVEPTDPDLPAVSALYENFPNPFTGATSIRYDVSAGNRVRLTLYDMLGRRVAVIVDEEVAAGRYEASFDARGLASGVYLYRLEVGEFQDVKRMLVVR